MGLALHGAAAHRASALGGFTLAALGVLAPFAACQRSHESTGAPALSASARANSAATPPSPPTPAAEAPSAASAMPQAPSAGCTAMRVLAQVTVRGASLGPRSTIPDDAWVELANGAELVVHHDLSGREWLLSGPGQFLVCPAGNEQIVMHRGKLRSSFGTGVRPGAEAWIFVPGGSARYGNAELAVEVTAARWSLELARGAASAEVWNAGAEPQKTELSRREQRFVHSGRADFSRLVAACVSAADKAETSARAVLAASSQELGKLAAEQLRDRRTARGRCGAARAAADPIAKTSQATQALLDALASAEQRWQQIPKSR